MDARQVTDVKQPCCSRVDLCLSYRKENTGASVAFWNGGHVYRGSGALICILWDSCLKHSTEVSCSEWVSMVITKFFLIVLPFRLNLKRTHGAGGLPWWLSGKESTCQCRRHWFDPWAGKIPHAAERLSPCATTTVPVL